ncbi:hypothetical protein yc1106_06413 [Curvularia clavata]|uniref:Amidohydrolase-related domain-containing protein n=1 Tax=Curvularia clavata TaxID=95742 RepID=A0A9Q8ZAQ7_CURCL|nr:hypothetical protein yc1106_06413 [Curvularia clavata]
MSQSHQRILDSHIHLWPSTATSSTDHGWMTPDHFLSKRHGITDYLSIATSPTPSGFIYVETDRYLPSPFPPSSSSSSSSSEEDTTQTLTQWAKQPLEEIKFLRRIAEATPADGDGFTPTDAEKMKGCVIYAPFHVSPALFSRYMAIAEETAGPRLWSQVVGFRYLLQGKGEGGVQKLVEEGEQTEVWVKNLSYLREGKGGKGRSFDVGVDVNRDGYAPFEVVGRLIASVRKEEEREGVEKGKGVRFVLNHLGKHPLSPSSPVPSPQWRDGIAAFADDTAVYMKFSGGFNEFVPSTPSDVPTLVRTLTPFFNHVYECFGSGRILFGSDWPVCNVGGQKGEEGNWGLWREVVETWMEEKGLNEEEREQIWWRSACEAYAVET